MFIIKRLTEQVIDFEYTAGIAGNQYRMVIVTELMRLFIIGKVYVILIFGTAVKDGAFVIVQMVTEIVLLYFSSPPS